MQLVFEVCDTGHGASASPQSKTFNGAGGVIGRGAGCDWIIPDPSRLLSNHHALVSYRDGRYFLTDVSSNGIRVGSNGARLRKGQARPVTHGAVFALGPFDIRAQLVESIASSNSSAQEVTPDSLIPDDAFLELDPVRAFEREQLSHETSDEWAALRTTAGAYGNWTGDSTVDRQHLILPELVELAPQAPPDPQPVVTTKGNEAFWAGVSQALGIGLDHLDEQGREALAIKAASLLRQTVEGVQQNLRTCSELKNELNFALTCTPSTSQNPLNDSVDTGAALEVLLGVGQLGQLSAELAVAQAYRDIQAHQVALLAACRAMARGALALFAPAYLTRCFERQDKPPRLLTSGAHWRAYQRHYQRLIEDDSWGERLLGNDFAKTYEEQIRLISTLHSTYPG